MITKPASKHPQITENTFCEPSASELSETQKRSENLGRSEKPEKHKGYRFDEDASPRPNINPKSTARKTDSPPEVERGTTIQERDLSCGERFDKLMMNDCFRWCILPTTIIVSFALPAILLALAITSDNTTQEIIFGIWLFVDLIGFIMFIFYGIDRARSNFDRNMYRDLYPNGHGTSS